MSILGPARPRPLFSKHLLSVAVSGSILGLFALSLFFLVLNTRLNPTRDPEMPPRDPSGEGRFHYANGFTLWYRDVGTNRDKPPIIYLHGGPGQSSSTFRESFKFLEDQYRVIYYDQRGSGNSQVRQSLSYYTMSSLVEELDEVRREVAKADSVILIGHDFGGALAQWYALAHPDEVSRLILLSPLPANGYRMNSIADVFLEPLEALLNAGIPPGDPYRANIWQQRFETRTAEDLLCDRTHAPLVQHLGGIFGTSRALVNSLAATKKGTASSLANLHIPTLILYGCRESKYTREEYQQELHRLLQDSRLIKLEQSGHWTFLEQPEHFQEAILQFLAGG